MEPFPFRSYLLKSEGAERYESQLKLPVGHENLAGPHAVPAGFPTSIAAPTFEHVGKPNTGVSFEDSLPLSSSLNAPTGFSVDKTTGKKFVVKQARNLAGHATDPQNAHIKVGNPRPGEATRHEALAGRIYRLFGYHVPASQLYDGLTGEPVKKDHDFGDNLDADDPFVAAHAPFLVSEHLGDRSRSMGEFYSDFIKDNDEPEIRDAALAQYKQVKRDFAKGAIMDAIMGNYDMHANNIGLDGREKSFSDRLIPWRWDVGASLGFNPHGNKKIWSHWGAPATKRSHAILPTLIAILQHDHQQRASEAPDRHFSMYSDVHEDPTIYKDLLDEMKRISTHARKNKEVIREMFGQIPKGDFHYGVFMDRIASVEEMLREHGTPEKLRSLLSKFVGPFETDVENFFAPTPGPHRPEGAPPLGPFKRIQRKFNPLFGRYRSIGERSGW